MIRVVSAGRFQDLTPQGPYLARTSLVCQQCPSLDLSELEVLDPGTDIEPDSMERLAAMLADEAVDRDVTYIATGAGVPGDAVLDAVPAELISEIHAGAARRGTFGMGACQVVDALSLAVAECRHPFDRGLTPIDPTVPVVVTNWHGAAVTSLARQRLTRTYGGDPLPDVTDDLELLVPARQHLTTSASLAELEQITARLRREDGCPWDREQTKTTLFPQFQEELEELGEAIRSGDIENQQEELGDVLFHVVAQCQLAAEHGDFTMDDVIRSITAKLIRRHPHVFGDEKVDSIDAVLDTWQRVKAEEKIAAREQTVE